jgi:hypothetical protein
MSVADLPYSIMGVAWVGLFYLETTGVPSPESISSTNFRSPGHR